MNGYTLRQAGAEADGSIGEMAGGGAQVSSQDEANCRPASRGRGQSVCGRTIVNEYRELHVYDYILRMS